MIKIEINENLLTIVEKTAGIIEEAQYNLKNFEKEAGLFCGGKSHEYLYSLS